jgi:peroxiredoxin
VGFNWWSWQDFQNLNQGLVSIHDNAYDGHEAVTGTVPCFPPTQTLTCGREEANYADTISQIKTANQLWWAVSPPIVPAGRGQQQ